MSSSFSTSLANAAAAASRNIRVVVSRVPYSGYELDAAPALRYQCITPSSPPDTKAEPGISKRVLGSSPLSFTSRLQLIAQIGFLSETTATHILGVCARSQRNTWWSDAAVATMRPSPLDSTSRIHPSWPCSEAIVVQVRVFPTSFTSCSVTERSSEPTSSWSAYVVPGAVKCTVRTGCECSVSMYAPSILTS